MVFSRHPAANLVAGGALNEKPAEALPRTGSIHGSFPERETRFEPESERLARARFPAVTRRYKIAKSQPAALPGRSTRFAEVVR
jgi:hypothetical protein